MLESYIKLVAGGEGEIIEKKSRFIGQIAPVATEEEAYALPPMKPGEMNTSKFGTHLHGCGVFETDKDLEAMESQKESIISERKSECYNNLLEKWKAEQEYKVNEDVVATVTVDDNLFQISNKKD